MKRIFVCVLFIYCFVLLTISAEAQNSKFLKFKRFEIDNKEVKQDFEVKIIVSGKEIVPLLFKNGFVIPPELENSESFDVVFSTDKYNLIFKSVDRSKLNTDWIIGIDNKPFDKSNTTFEQFNVNIKLIYYVKFVSKEGHSIVQTVFVDNLKEVLK